MILRALHEGLNQKTERRKSLYYILKDTADYKAMISILIMVQESRSPRKLCLGITLFHISTLCD